MKAKFLLFFLRFSFFLKLIRVKNEWPFFLTVIIKSNLIHKVFKTLLKPLKPTILNFTDFLALINLGPALSLVEVIKSQSCLSINKINEGISHVQLSILINRQVKEVKQFFKVLIEHLHQSVFSYLIRDVLYHKSGLILLL